MWKKTENRTDTILIRNSKINPSKTSSDFQRDLLIMFLMLVIQLYCTGFRKFTGRQEDHRKKNNAKMLKNFRMGTKTINHGLLMTEK